MKDKKIMIIDAMNSVFRSYAVDPTMNTKGEHIGALMGFLKQMQKMSRDIKPDEIYVIWDGAGGSARRQSMNKGYKDGRKSVNPARYNRHVDIDVSEAETQKNKAWQISRLVEILNEMPVKQYVHESIEADDIIAILSKLDCMKDSYKFIISNDKDFYQLLDEKTIIYRAATKKYMTMVDVIEEEGVHPNNMSLARAIYGDKSDNLPGVKGVGPKTLTKAFPFLKEEEKKYVDDLINEIKEMKKPSQALQKLVLERSTIVDNYKIMQLYNPVIKRSALEMIEDLACDSDPTYNWSKAQGMMINDGFGTYNWSSLQETFRRIMKQVEEKDDE
jgi:DNA polymerase-1